MIEQVLDPATWRARRAAHEERARTLLAGVIERRAHGQRHPVEDFMFDYYRLRPGQLIEWHPGARTWLAEADELADRRWYTRLDRGAGMVVGLDVAALARARMTTLEFTERLLRATGGRPAQFGCFGMHEWAMVYGLTPDQTRHPNLPLRFEPDRIRQIVDETGLRCTHYDAFRFFTHQAAPRNAHQLSRDDQVNRDQGGCLPIQVRRQARPHDPLRGAARLL